MINHFSTKFINYLFGYFFISGIAFLVFYVIFKDRFKKIKIQKKNASKSFFKKEILNSLLTIFIFTIMLSIFHFIDLKKHSMIYNNINDYPLYWIPLGFFLNFVIHDLWFYWLHRLMHNPKLFKWIHLTHHNSKNPSPWASYSFHFIEAIAEGAIIFIIMLIIPNTIYTLLASRLSYKNNSVQKKVYF